MTDESTSVDTESLPPDNYLGPKRSVLRLRCLRCGNVYKSRPFVVEPKKKPLCPRVKCRVAREVEAQRSDDERMRVMLEERRAPGHIGANPVNRMIDDVAEGVMRDYGLTNLSDSQREGDIAAPKLPPEQQRAADSFFNGAEVARRAGGSRMAARARQLGQMALVGGGTALRNQSARIGKIQASVARPGDPGMIIRQDSFHPDMVKATPRR